MFRLLSSFSSSPSMSKGSGTGGRAPSESCDFLLLPRDMLLYLARFLDAPDLGALARCNKQLRDFYSQDAVWKQLCMDASPEYKSPSDYGQETWKECYRVIKTPIPTLTRTFSSGTTHRINMTVWDNEYMVAVGSKDIGLWRRDYTPVVTKMDKHTNSIQCCEVYDGLLWTAGADHVICVWTKEGKLVDELHKHTDWVIYMKAFRGYMFTGCYSNVIYVWNKARRCVATLKGHDRYLHCFGQWDNQLVSGSGEGLVCVWGFGNEAGEKAGANAPMAGGLTDAFDSLSMTDEQPQITLVQKYNLPKDVLQLVQYGKDMIASSDFGLYRLKRNGASERFHPMKHPEHVWALCMWQGRLYAGSDKLRVFSMKGELLGEIGGVGDFRFLQPWGGSLWMVSGPKIGIFEKRKRVLQDTDTEAGAPDTTR